MSRRADREGVPRHEQWTRAHLPVEIGFQQLYFARWNRYYRIYLFKYERGSYTYNYHMTRAMFCIKYAREAPKPRLP